METRGSQLGPGSAHARFETESLQKKSGCYISLPKVILICVAVVAALLAVGLGVHFGRPPCPTCRVPPTPSANEQWENCKRLAEERGECLCNKTAPEKITGFRLNKTLLPVHYNVELKPDIYLPQPGLKFIGHVQIWMRCHQTTNMLVLHISRLVINGNTIEFREDGGDVIPFSRWEEDKERHFFKLYLTKNLTVNKMYCFRVEFQGILTHSDIYGFYAASYQQDNQTRYLAVTQFQAHHARRAFPCFDEPGMKATFNITLVRKPGYSSLSNMELLHTEQRPGGYEADVFHKSVKMSVYLVAFVVSDFVQKNVTTARGALFRHWSRRDYIHQMDYALNISGYILEAFEDYTEIPYNLSKIDQVAIPGFDSDGMENWGLVLYNEYRILYNANYSTMADKRYNTYLIGHELAHKWWGNLVTCDWWDDLFLNEGFAEYYANFVVDLILPHWKMEETLMRYTLGTLESDGYTTSQPVRLPNLEHHKDYDDAFGSVVYNKGAAVVRMISYLLGHDTFRRAMNYYLTTHAYQSVTMKDLYSALQRQAELDDRVTWDDRRRNISLILQTWLDQQGHPVVSVSDRGGGKYFLSQEHFLYDPDNEPYYPSPFGFTWDIPLSHSTENQLLNNTSGLTWMYREDTEVNTSDAGFILANYLQQGFFRVNYQDKLWDTMVQKLNHNHKVINVLNRAQLIDDALNLAKANRRTEVQAIETTEYLINETEYIPWYSFRRRMDFYHRMFYNTETYESWQRYLLDRAVTTVYGHVGWDDSKEEHQKKYLRQFIMSIACNHGFEPCQREARRQYQQFMIAQSFNPISPNLRPTVYCEGIKSGGSAEWDFAYKMYEKKYDGFIADEKTVLLTAMACSRIPWILRRYLNMAVEWQLTWIIQQIAGNPVGSSVVWDFLMSKWNIWPDGLSKTSILTTLTSTYSTKYDLEKFDAFTRMFPDENMQNTYSSIWASIQNNIRWMETNEVPLRNWFISVNNKQERIDMDSERRLADVTIHFQEASTYFARH